MINPLLTTLDSFDNNVVCLDINLHLEQEINQLIHQLNQSDDGYDNYIADILSKLHRLADMLNEYLMKLLNGEPND